MKQQLQKEESNIYHKNAKITHIIEVALQFSVANPETCFKRKLNCSLHVERTQITKQIIFCHIIFLIGKINIVFSRF